jgi:hypothetical protein
MPNLIAAVLASAAEEAVMKKYLVIYNVPVTGREQMAKATPEQMKAGADAWMRWAQKAGKNLLDLGAPLGNSARVTAGRPADHKTEIGGFSIIQADSRDALAALLAEHPHLTMPGTTIDIHEFMPIPGM